MSSSSGLASADRRGGRGLPHRWWALLAACVVAAALPGASRAVDYVALGDSVASGYGLEPAAGPCYRTQGAYPRLVLERLRERQRVGRFAFLACSGAEARAASGPRSLRSQVTSALALIGSRRPTLVSVTIGINDLGWWNLGRARELLDGDRATFEAWLRGSLRSIGIAIERELRRLLARPAVRIVLTEYYDPFNRGSPLFLLCEDAARCRKRTDEVVTAMNRMLRGLAGPRVRVARIQARFRGHEGPRPRCGVLPPDAARSWIQLDCIHPNGRGARAIALAVDREALRLGR